MYTLLHKINSIPMLHDFLNDWFYATQDLRPYFQLQCPRWQRLFHHKWLLEHHRNGSPAMAPQVSEVHWVTECPRDRENPRLGNQGPRAAWVTHRLGLRLSPSSYTSKGGVIVSRLPTGAQTQTLPQTDALLWLARHPTELRMTTLSGCHHRDTQLSSCS